MIFIVAAFVLGALHTPPSAPPSNRHSIAINGLRYDDPFGDVASATGLFSQVNRRDPHAHPFSLSLRREHGRLVWRILAAQGARTYTMKGRYASPVATYIFDAKSDKLLSRSVARMLQEPRILPNRTPPPQNGPTTPCPLRGPGAPPSPPAGFYYSTPPPNAIPGQNYNCLHPIAGTSPWHRPPANAMQNMREFPALDAVYAIANERARAAHAYVVEIALIPFGSAQATYESGVYGYDTEAARMTLVTTTIAPRGMNASPCFFDYAVITSMVDAVTQRGGGASIRGHCRAGTLGHGRR